MDILTTILQVVLGLVFLVSGFKRIVVARKAEDGFDWWRYPRWFRPVAGFAELIGGVCMLAGIFMPAIAPVAGLWLALLMLVSLVTHILRVRNITWLFPAVLLLLAGAVVQFRLMALLLTLLMSAIRPDPAPLDIAPATEVVRFENDAGEFFESIDFNDKGDVFLSIATTGEIRKVASDGTQTTLAMLPSGEFNLRTFEGILAALVEREREGTGQLVETSLLGAGIHLQAYNVNMALLRGKPIPRNSRYTLKNPMAIHYQCSDGNWIILSEPQSDRFWHDFCIALGIENLEKDPKFATAADRRDNHSEIREILDKVFASKTQEEWIRILEDKGKGLAFSPPCRNVSKKSYTRGRHRLVSL